MFKWDKDAAQGLIIGLLMTLAVEILVYGTLHYITGLW